MQAAVFTVVFLVACGAFFYRNAALVAAPMRGADGKALPPAVRTVKEAQTCGCYFADQASLGAKLCKDALPAEVKEEMAQKEFRKTCLNQWFADPAAKCPELCTKAKDPAACKASCAAVGQAPKVAAGQVGYCTERVINLE
jgi:hypothetical protein